MYFHVSFSYFRLASTLQWKGNKLHFYRLVLALRKQANTVFIQVRVVEEQTLARYQKTTYKRSQDRLSTLWEQYEAKTIRTSNFKEQRVTLKLLQTVALNVEKDNANFFFTFYYHIHSTIFNKTFSFIMSQRTNLTI
jgi:hypothetical protein